VNRRIRAAKVQLFKMTRNLSFLSLVTILVGIFLYRRPSEDAPTLPRVMGRNNTVLFLTTELHGLSNVHAATTFALLENHPEIEVHFASFPSLQKKISRISSAARTKNPAAKPVVWHDLPGTQTFALFLEVWGSSDGLITQPGSKGLAKRISDFDLILAPWSAEEHWAIFQALSKLVDEVDPAVVVFEFCLSPARDLAKNSNRQFIMISPNGVMDLFANEQPNGGMLWKYPQ
jgi:hypothetical protein